MSVAVATALAPAKPAKRALPKGLNLEMAAIGTLTFLWCLGVLLPILSLAALSFVKSQGIGFTWNFTIDNYSAVLVDYRMQTILRTLRIVLTVTLIELILAFPFALWLAKGLKPSWKKSVLLVLLVVPFFLSPAARTIVWRSVLGNNGLINSLLRWLGVIDQPLDWLLFTQFSVHLGLIGPISPRWSGRFISPSRWSMTI